MSTAYQSWNSEQNVAVHRPRPDTRDHMRAQRFCRHARCGTMQAGRRFCFNLLVVLGLAFGALGGLVRAEAQQGGGAGEEYKWSTPRVGRLVHLEPTDSVEFVPIWKDGKFLKVAMVANTVNGRGEQGVLIQEASGAQLIESSRFGCAVPPFGGSVFLPGRFQRPGEYRSFAGARVREQGIVLLGTKPADGETDGVTQAAKIVVRKAGGEMSTLDIGKHSILVNQGGDGLFAYQAEEGGLTVCFMGFMREQVGADHFTFGLHSFRKDAWLFTPFASGPELKLEFHRQTRGISGDLKLGVGEEGEPKVVGIVRCNGNVGVFAFTLGRTGSAITVHRPTGGGLSGQRIIASAENHRSENGEDEFFVVGKEPIRFSGTIGEGSWELLSLRERGIEHLATIPLVANFGQEPNRPDMGEIEAIGVARHPNGSLASVVTASEWPWTKKLSAVCFAGTGMYLAAVNRYQAPFGVARFCSARSILFPVGVRGYVLVSGSSMWSPGGPQTIPERGSVSVMHLAPGKTEPPASVPTKSPMSAIRIGTIPPELVFAGLSIELNL